MFNSWEMRRQSRAASKKKDWHSDFRHEIEEISDIFLDSLGPASKRLKLEGFEQYAQMSAQVFAATGWKPSEFRAFRVAAPNLPVPSTLVLEMQIAD